MPERRYRVLFICTHPVQYASPVFRRMASHPRLDIEVAYCSLQGAEPGIDREFGVEVKWDVPLLDGYPWVHVQNRAPRPGLNRFFGLINPGLWKLVSAGGYDAVVAYTGYRCVSFWIALAAAKLHGIPIIFGTDACALASRDRKAWKIKARRTLWAWVYRLATVVVVPSTRSFELMRSLGVSDRRLVLTPYVVDNDWWSQQAGAVDRGEVRRRWGVPENAPVILFCAKLQRWKRPLDLLHAFSRANLAGSHLVFAGDGPLRAELASWARTLGLEQRTHFLGFVNQSVLPAIYSASDLMVLPSEYEPFGVVVNEAMLCGCPVIVSDRVGAGGDLIDSGCTGYTFRCGDVEALAALLREALSDRERLARTREAAHLRMKTWSPRENVQAHVLGFERAVQLARGAAA